jgi:hypothetical protein
MEDEPRKNAVLTAIVEYGVRLEGEQGAAIAWAYLQAYKVPREAILRVLAYPDARRRRSRKPIP